MTPCSLPTSAGHTVNLVSASTGWKLRCSRASPSPYPNRARRGRARSPPAPRPLRQPQGFYSVLRCGHEFWVFFCCCFFCHGGPEQPSSVRLSVARPHGSAGFFGIEKRPDGFLFLFRLRHSGVPVLHCKPVWKFK